VSVVEAAVEVEAPREAVWAVVADPRNLPRWDRHIVRVEGVPEDGLRPGSRYVTHVRFLGVQARVRAEVVELRAPEYAKVRLAGVVEALVETRLEPLDGGRTLLRHRVEYRFPGGRLGRLAASAVRMVGASLILARGARAQKRQVEEGPGRPAATARPPRPPGPAGVGPAGRGAPPGTRARPPGPRRPA
jgi:uncharacterized membrane protein